jgi:hypothetical protein
VVSRKRAYGRLSERGHHSVVGQPTQVWSVRDLAVVDSFRAFLAHFDEELRAIPTLDKIKAVS